MHSVDNNWELRAIRQQLKEIIKQRNMTYAELAKEMKVSEITIKRFFTSSDITFRKLQQVCEVIGFSAVELISLVKKGAEQSFELTEEQESYLSKNERLYDFFVLLLKTRSLQQTLRKGSFKGENIPKFLRELNSLALIEIPTGDRVHVKRSGTLTWRKHGPLQKKFMRKRHEKYLDAFESAIDEPLNFLTSSQRQLRPESITEMKRDLEFIAQKYRDRAYVEELTCTESQLVSVAWLIGLGKYQHI